MQIDCGVGAKVNENEELLMNLAILQKRRHQPASYRLHRGLHTMNSFVVRLVDVDGGADTSHQTALTALTSRSI